MSARDRISDALRQVWDWTAQAARSRSGKFLIAVLGIVLVAITPNPPGSWLDWLQIIGGATLSALLTVQAAAGDTDPDGPTRESVLLWVRDFLADTGRGSSRSPCSSP